MAKNEEKKIVKKWTENTMKKLKRKKMAKIDKFKKMD